MCIIYLYHQGYKQVGVVITSKTKTFLKSRNHAHTGLFNDFSTEILDSVKKKKMTSCLQVIEEEVIGLNGTVPQKFQIRERSPERTNIF